MKMITPSKSDLKWFLNMLQLTKVPYRNNLSITNRREIVMAVKTEAFFYFISHDLI